MRKNFTVVTWDGGRKILLRLLPQTTMRNGKNGRGAEIGSGAKPQGVGATTEWRSQTAGQTAGQCMWPVRLAIRRL